MPGPGSQEPHIVNTGRNVPPRAVDAARFEPLPLDRDRPKQSLSTRVRVFPARASATAPAAARSTTSRDTARDVTGAAAAASASTDAAAAAAVDSAKQREGRTPGEPVTPPRGEASSAAAGNLPRPALHIIARAGRLTWDATILLLFSPVIAVWWLLERRHRKGGR